MLKKIAEVLKWMFTPVPEVYEYMGPLECIELMDYTGYQRFSLF